LHLGGRCERAIDAGPSVEAHAASCDTDSLSLRRAIDAASQFSLAGVASVIGVTMALPELADTLSTTVLRTRNNDLRLAGWTGPPEIADAAAELAESMRVAPLRFLLPACGVRAHSRWASIGVNSRYQYLFACVSCEPFVAPASIIDADSVPAAFQCVAVVAREARRKREAVELLRTNEE
jgi:hypothetical protein